jgi:hypothetical protein
MIQERVIEPVMKSCVGDWKRIFYNLADGKDEEAFCL